MATLIAPQALPYDVRVMNGVATALYVLLGLALLGGALLWLSRAPWFAIRAIQLEGDLQRSSVSTIRANATPRLAGNFVSLDLAGARAAFEAVPWVRQAQVRRVWPDRLAVHLVEHQPAAFWLGEDGNERLVNAQGEVFEANLGDVEDPYLPTLSGPDGTSAQMLALARRLGPLFGRTGMQLGQLKLSGRGSWRAEFDDGAVIDIGRGSEDELVARCERFLRTVRQVSSRYAGAIEQADLRHTQGYALRLRGVTTTQPAASAATATRKKN